MIFLGNILEVNKIKTIIVNYYNKNVKFDKNAQYYADSKIYGPLATLVVAESALAGGEVASYVAGREIVVLADTLMRDLGLVDSPSGLLGIAAIPKASATVDAKKEAISAMRDRALKAKHMESTTRRITLHPDDLAALDQMPIRAIAVIPTVNLDEETVVSRFGNPGERLAVSENRVHLLYPDKGLDVVVDRDGKELLQYVAPRDFALLRDPLKASAAGKNPAQ